MARFKLFRYHKPSVNSMLGVTRVKRAVKRKSGCHRSRFPASSARMGNTFMARRTCVRTEYDVEWA
jgi:hypothetical protein